MKEKLRPKQAIFVIEYLKDLNGTQAAIRAGYSEHTACEMGSENLRKPHIQEAIQEQMDARANRTLITADWVLNCMKEVANRCLQKKSVMIFDKVAEEYVQLTETKENEKGELVEEGVWQFDSAGANKALENLARNLKLLTDKTEMSGPGGVPLEVPKMQAVFVNSPEEVPPTT